MTAKSKEDAAKQAGEKAFNCELQYHG